MSFESGCTRKILRALEQSDPKHSALFLLRREDPTLMDLNQVGCFPIALAVGDLDARGVLPANSLSQFSKFGERSGIGRVFNSTREDLIRIKRPLAVFLWAGKLKFVVHNALARHPLDPAVLARAVFHGGESVAIESLDTFTDLLIRTHDLVVCPNWDQVGGHYGRTAVGPSEALRRHTRQSPPLEEQA